VHKAILLAHAFDDEVAELHVVGIFDPNLQANNWQ
jgi:hypothetical protein